MSEPDVMRQATERIDEQKFLLESDVRIKNLNAEESSPQRQAPSVNEIRQMIQDLAARGLSPEEIQANLAQRGISVRL